MNFWIISADEKRNRTISETIGPIELILNQKDIEEPKNRICINKECISAY